jgi:lipopolysaccharide transport system permease protein
VWSYFANNLTKTAVTFVANANLYGKVYFHRLAIPVSIVISNLISFGIQFGIFLIILVGYVVLGKSVHPNAWLLLTPLLLLMLAGLSLGFGIIVSALTTRYRDLVQLLTFGVQLWMYATPVVYPLSMVPMDRASQPIDGHSRSLSVRVSRCWLPKSCSDRIWHAVYRGGYDQRRNTL